MYDGRITCGISSTDTTQHRLFAFEVDIEEECPIEPSILTIGEVAELARAHMRSKNIDLPAEKYNTFVVSARQQNVTKDGAANAKYRAVVYVPTNVVFAPGSKSSAASSIVKVDGSIGHSSSMSTSNANSMCCVVSVLEISQVIRPSYISPPS